LAAIAFFMFRLEAAFCFAVRLVFRLAIWFPFGVNRFADLDQQRNTHIKEGGLRRKVCRARLALRANSRSAIQSTIKGDVPTQK
jgi:hypothetical protein